MNNDDDGKVGSGENSLMRVAMLYQWCWWWYVSCDSDGGAVVLIVVLAYTPTFSCEVEGALPPREVQCQPPQAGSTSADHALLIDMPLGVAPILLQGNVLLVKKS